MKKPLRIIFFGMEGCYSTLPLRAIISRHNVVAVYSNTNPILKTTPIYLLKKIVRRSLAMTFRYQSKKQNNTSKGIAEISLENGIPYHPVPNINASYIKRELSLYDPDLICIAGFNQIIAEILTIPRIGVLNAHGSMLPDFRGRDTFFWMVKTGVKTGGCTIHWAIPEVDAGRILAQKSFELFTGMTVSEYYDMTRFFSGELYLKVLDACQCGNIPYGEPNEPVKKTPYCRHPKSADLEISTDYTREHALWFYSIASKYGIPFVRDHTGVIKCRVLSRKRLSRGIQIEFQDGSLWAIEP